MIIAGVIACVLLVLLTLIIARKKEKEYARCIKAADVLFKYKGLDDSLFRDQSWNSVTARPYVLIQWKDGEKQSFVFDPEKGIHIGYDPHFNQIGILDKTVSAKHCVLYSIANRLYIQDLNSTNGTKVNGITLLPEVARSLSDGDIIGISEKQYRFLSIPSTK